MSGLRPRTNDAILHTLRIRCGGIRLTAALDNCSEKTYCNEITYKRLPKILLLMKEMRQLEIYQSTHLVAKRFLKCLK